MQPWIKLEIINFLSLFIGIGVLLVLARKHLLRKLWAVSGFLAVRILSQLICMPPLFFRKQIGLSRLAAYHVVMIGSWPCIIAEAILMVLVIYSVYSHVLQPFAPLKTLGTIMFRWVGAISLAVSIGVAIGPHMFSTPHAVDWISQVQQASSILTVCLLLFVTFALKPLGLTFRSQYFGTCLGLGIIATVSLVQAAWLTVAQAQSVYSMMYVWSDIVVCAGLCVWGAYFIAPEPKRHIVVLPTTSPFFFWNRISEALGDSPGVVALSGFSPEDLAPAELEVLMSASSAPEDRAPRILNSAAYGS